MSHALKGIALAITALGGLPAWAAEFVPEHATVMPLPPATRYRLYVNDAALSNYAEGRLVVLDGEHMTYLGTLGIGMLGQSTLSPDRSELYVVTTYYTRINRGRREDVVEIYDPSNLTFKSEIPIPPKHALSLKYRGNVRTSSDGRWLIAQNATPAASLTVVDLKSRQFVSEIPAPGCWIVLPSQTHPKRFATLCGDGTVLTFTLDETGHVVSQQRSDRIFDPDKDPLFVSADTFDDRYVFVSFHGNAYIVNVSGEKAALEALWPIVTEQDKKQGWRPGGYEPLAVQRATQTLYVAMHPNGKEGTHKNPASEIWSFDLRSRQRIARMPGSHAIVLAVSQGLNPMLFAVDGERSGVVAYQIGGGSRPSGRLDLGETITDIEVQ